MLIFSFGASHEALGGANLAWQTLMNSCSVPLGKGRHLSEASFVNKLGISMLGVVPMEEDWSKPSLSHQRRWFCFAALGEAVAGMVGHEEVHGTNWGSLHLTHWVAVSDLWTFFNALCPSASYFLFCVTMWCCRKSFGPGSRDTISFLVPLLTVILIISFLIPLLTVTPSFLACIHRFILQKLSSAYYTLKRKGVSGVDMYTLYLK